MNSKLLFAATVAVSLLSTWAMAAEPHLTREQVKAELNQAIATHTLQRSDYDTAPRDVVVTGTKTRAQVAAELAADNADRARLIGPDANRTFNPVGTQVLQPLTFSRAEVKEETRLSAAEGTLRRTDYDDQPQAAQRVLPRTASPTFAQRIKAAFAKLQG